MAKAPYRIRRRGDSWMTDFFLGGKRVRKAFETKQEAEGWILTQRAGALQGASPTITTKPEVSLKFEEIAGLMLDDLHRLARSSETLNDYADRLARLAIPHIGDTPVRAISRKTIQDLIAKLHELNYSAGEMNRGLAIVRRTLQWAVEHDHADSNVAASIKRIPAPPHREPAFLTEEEQAAILSRLKGQAYGLILTALRTGMRRKELRFFEFAWVDFERDTISVPYTIDFKPKGKRRRSIPLAPDLREWLLSLGRDTGYVFATRGNYKHKRSQKKALWELRRLTQAAERQAGVSIRLHDLRHAFASTMMARGVRLDEIQAVLGHQDLTTTTRIYLHLSPAYLESVRTAMMWHRCGTTDGNRSTNAAEEKSEKVVELAPRAASKEAAPDPD